MKRENNMEIIKLKIDVTKIDKARLFTGKKGIYLSLVMFPAQNSSYGDDYCIKQDCTPEEGKAGLKLPIIGNGKIIATAARQKQALQDAKAAAKPAEKSEQGGEDDIPF